MKPDKYISKEWIKESGYPHESSKLIFYVGSKVFLCGERIALSTDGTGTIG